jgi:hypothetical protein
MPFFGRKHPIPGQKRHCCGIWDVCHIFSGRNEYRWYRNAKLVLYPDLPAMIISGDTAPSRLREVQAGGIELMSKAADKDALFEVIVSTCR